MIIRVWWGVLKYRKFAGNRKLRKVVRVDTESLKKAGLIIGDPSY